MRDLKLSGVGDQMLAVVCCACRQQFRAWGSCFTCFLSVLTVLMATSTLRDAVRKLLLGERVALWKSPYTNEDGSLGHIPDEMVDRYREVCGASRKEILETLNALREHAYAKYTDRKVGDGPKLEVFGDVVVSVRGHSDNAQDVAVRTTLRQPVSYLRQAISQQGNLSPSSFKLIACGKILEENKALGDEGVKFGSGSVIAVLLSPEQQRQEQQWRSRQEILRVREAAKALASRNDEESIGHDRRYLEICDQNGKPLDLPVAERQSLSLALALHQKGRSLLSAATGDSGYCQALGLLQEADHEFQQCRADILSMVDNSAILCLDICWCQLLLREAAALPEAQRRLAECEEHLRRSYGRNMERLSSLRKGKVGAEVLLLARLHLLQAATAYHTGRLDEAKHILSVAEKELQSLQIDSGQLAHLVDLTGCSERAGRVALRACSHNVEQAAHHLLEKQEQQAQRQAAEQQRQRQRQRSRMLGRVAGGSGFVDVDKYDTLTGMGFPRSLCAVALRQCSNNLQQALVALQDNYAQLEQAALLDYQKVSRKHTRSSSQQTGSEAADELIQQGVAMGFDEAVIREGLARHNGRLQHLLNELLSGSTGEAATSDGSEFIDAELAAALAFDPESLADVYQQTREHSSGSSSSNSASGSSNSDIDQTIESELVPDLTAEPENEYLDSSLEKEMEIFSEYQAQISSAASL